MVKFKHFGPQN